MTDKRVRIGVSLGAAMLVLIGLLLTVGHTGAALPHDASKLVQPEPIRDEQQGATAAQFGPDSAIIQLSSGYLERGAEEISVSATPPAGPSCLGCQSQASFGATVFVSITESGLDPAVVTITVGSTVVWTNYLQEAVHLARLYRVYLPLVVRGDGGLAGHNRSGRPPEGAGGTAATSASPRVADESRVRQGNEWGNVNIAPGQSYTHTFTLADQYSYSLAGAVQAEGGIRVEPLQTDEPILMWATGSQGVLLRWRWPSREAQSARPADQPTGYYVYRDGNLLNTQPITHVTDPQEATAILGSHWNWIRETYTDVNTIAELHAFLKSNRLAEQWLADQRYPVALVRGLGYLDDAVMPGDPYTHTYRVEAMLWSGPQDVGTAAIKNDGVTPLAPPSAVTVTTVVSDALRRSPDWVLAQKNRRAHRNVFLIWDLPAESPGRQQPQQWTTSYDIFRAGPVEPGQDPATMAYTCITEEPVVPMADHDPVPLALVGGDPYALPYERHSYYYADTSETLGICETYAYRVAPRDLLGQTCDWSSFVTASVPDTMPPDPPAVLTPTVDHGGGTIAITWQPVADAAQYRVYRSEVLTAGWPGLTDCGVYSCWITMTTTTATSWADTSAVHEQRYWYVVRAEDASCGNDPPNMSAPSNAVAAVLHDRVPPGPPSGMNVSEDIIYWTPDQDTQYSLLYCSFDDDPMDGAEAEMMMIAEVPSTTTYFDPAAYYTAPVPTDITCWLQPVDANGNRGQLTPLNLPFDICQTNIAYTLTAPTIVSVTTQEGGVHGWTARIQWDIEEDLPTLDGFHVYRQEGSGQKQALTPSKLGYDVRQFEDDGVKPGFLYTYTVAAVLAPGCGDEFPRFVHSGARLYKVVPPLDWCTRPVHNLPWDDNPANDFVPSQGTHLYWRHPYLDLGYGRVVVYRSLKKAGDYVAITPPFETIACEYLDADAEHGNYWYVVTMLDWATGEILYKTTPWSDASSTSACADGPTPVVAPGMAGDLPERSALAAWRGIGRPDLHLPPLTAPTDDFQIGASADTFIAEDAADVNYGRESLMRVSYSSEGPIRRHALVEFDLSVIPYGSTIDWAEFSAYLDTYAGVEGADIRLLGVTSPWEENEVIWDNRPSVDGTYFTLTVPNHTGWYTWNVTDLLAEWVYTPTIYPNYGFQLQGLPGDYTRDFSTSDGTSPPKLRVYYFPPPGTLHFGTQGDNVFEVTDVTYDPGSTPWCMTGSGSVALGGSPLATYSRDVTFSCIQVLPDGVVTSGTATVTLPSPIQVDYPDGFRYEVSSLAMSETTAWGLVALTLTDNIVDHYIGIPNHTPTDLLHATIRQDLTFDVEVNWWNDLLGGQNCNMATPHYYFEMNPLPLRIVPLGPVTFTNQFINVGDTCTQYDERYTPLQGQPRPSYPLPDANDGYLRPVYTSTGHTHIHSDGLSGGFSTSEPVSYTTAMPYGFDIQASNGISFAIVAGRISDGVMWGPIDLSLDYYRVPAPQTLTTTGVLVPAPNAVFDGFVDIAHWLWIGADGALFGEVLADLPWWPQPDPLPVSWAGGGFELREPAYFLYILPIQTGPTHDPWEEAAADWIGNDEVQAGLNRVTPDSVDFTWYHCKGECGAAATEIKFPEGVSADLYLRRGGVSGLLEARIPLGSGEPVTLYGYEHMLYSFRLSFCDNYIFDSEVEADLYLPFPAGVTIPLVDMQINPNNACMESGRVRGDADPLTLLYWELDLHARAVEYRPQGKCNRKLWLLGTMDIPHLAPPGESKVAPIPLEVSFDPDGTYNKAKPVYSKSSYKFDGFSFLLSSMALSPYPHPSGNPDWRWADEATLVTSPTVSGGLVKLQGNTVTPVFGTLKEKGGSSSPDVFVLGWDDYVGFSEQPEAKRTWTVLSDITWGFDLVYAQHHVTSTPRGAFVGFGTHDFKVVTMTRALVLNSWSEPAKVRADILLGLSAGTGALRALAETTVATLPTSLSGDPLSTLMRTQWVPKFGMDADHVTLLQDIWSGYGSKTYAKTTEVIDAWADTLANKDEGIPDDPSGGGTTGLLDTWGVKLKKIRGTMIWTLDTGTGDSHFEELRISLWLDVQQSKEKPLVHADRLTFYITRDGEYVLQGKGVESTLYESSLEKADFIAAIKPKAPSFEACVTLYKLKVEGIVAEKAAATLGVGADLFYLGALVHDAHPEYDLGGSVKLGGALLFGLIDPNSQVLKNGSFSTILKDIGATGATKGNGGLDAKGRLAGGYVRVYGEIPIYDVGCFFRIKAGGEMAAWYFAQFKDSGSCDLYGGRLRGYIHGKLLCVVSARGDLTLQIYRKSPGGQCAADPSLRGQFWAAGGLGFCDPEDWDTWEHRWWGDSWCWTAGAIVEANYNDNKPNGWWWHYDADYE
jgi:plastocyanin